MYVGSAKCGLFHSTVFLEILEIQNKDSFKNFNKHNMALKLNFCKCKILILTRILTVQTWVNDHHVYNDHHFEVPIWNFITKSRDYQCNICPSKFGENGNLKKHIKSVHKNIKYFYCDICQSSFVNISILKRHIKTVHEKRDFKCIVCLRAFGCTVMDIIKAFESCSWKEKSISV